MCGGGGGGGELVPVCRALLGFEVLHVQDVDAVTPVQYVPFKSKNSSEPTDAIMYNYYNISNFYKYRDTSRVSF